MIVPVATRVWERVPPGITVAAKDITATETNRWATAGRDAGNAGEKGEEGEGGLHPLAGSRLEMALVKVHWHKLLNRGRLSRFILYTKIPVAEMNSVHGA